MMNKKRWIGNSFFLLLLVITVIWAVQVRVGFIPFVDRPTREIVERLNDTFIYEVFLHITEMGSRSFLIPFVFIMAIILMFLYKHWLPGVLFAGGTLATHIINTVIKHVTTRERPSILESANAEGYSFPSGHAMISMVCYGLLAYFISRKLPSTTARLAFQSACALLVLLIGISRFVINVHFLTDVLAGFIIGFVFLMFFISIHKKFSYGSPTRGGEKSNP